jgi:LuxR family maltose regulon positive regulatory protein
MLDFLLATKLSIPEGPRGAVPRPRLTQALEEGIPRHRLTIVAGPAGYGKTTLLAEWARSTATPVAWLSLSAADDDPERFLRYLLAAWERIQPHAPEGPLAILSGLQSPDPQLVVSTIVNAAAQRPAHQAIVLDDVNAVQDEAVHASLALLLENLPPHLHLVLGTRADPPLPLARLRARGQLLELRAEDLRFTLEETADFLNRSLPAPLPDDDIRRWQERLEGWAAGLQLAALSLRHRGPVAPGGAPASGRQRFIADYLSEDVLAHQPPERRDFLLRTGILERLCAPLCEAVTETSGAQRQLEQLEHENLFIEALDPERRWFRYHPLFADFLRAQLEHQRRDEIAGLHQRAANWYAAQELAEPAFEHALAAGDAAQVVQLLGEHALVKLMRGEVRVVQRWLEAVPEAWRSEEVLYDLARSGVLAFTGSVDDAVRCVDDVQQRLAGATGQRAQRQMARVKAVRCALACMHNDVPAAEAYAGEALRELAPEDLIFRVMINVALGDTYRFSGRWLEAKACYLRALDVAETSRLRFISIPALGALADLDLRQGRLRHAAAYWRQALAVIHEPESWGSLELPVVGWVHIRLSEILYEWGQFGPAWEHLALGLEQAEVGGDARAIIAGCLCAGRLKLAEGDPDAAGDYLERARARLAQAQFPDWAARFQRLQLELWLAGDQLQAAADWALAVLASGTLDAQPESETIALAVARALIARGDAPALDPALALLERLRAAAEAEGRTGIAIEALALQALARWRLGEVPRALTALEQALRLAEPEGYLRLFVDLGLPMARLLQEARSRTVRRAYVQTLLAGFAGAFAAPAPGAALPEPLTGRELEVLRLLAAGLTNREIAAQLVISPETVKKHSANIYAKLGAANRTQAVARARELDLLD